VVIEIERKFLVLNDLWRAAAGPGVRFRQGYLSKTAAGTVRVRCTDHGASITIKSPRRGLTRQELSYELPLAEGEELLTRCPGLVDKIRHQVAHDGAAWEIDVYLGAARGLVIAEIELEREEQSFTIPPWLGVEVSNCPLYRNSAIALWGADRPPRRPAAGTAHAAPSSAASVAL